MDYLINFAMGVIGSLVVAEIIFRYELWCRRIIRAAARRIEDPEMRAIRLEEWLAALNDSVGLTASFSHAIGCWFGAPAVAAEAKPVARAIRARDRKATLQFSGLKIVNHQIIPKLFRSLFKDVAAILETVSKVKLWLSFRIGVGVAISYVMYQALQFLIKFLH
jgi:hypothetical protein